MKNKKWFLLLALVIVASGGTWYFLKVRDAEKTTYKEVKVHKGTLQQTILATGTVQPENRVGIKPPIAGRVEKVLAQEGDKVHKGQILAWMSSTERAALLDAATSKGPAELKRVGRSL